MKILLVKPQWFVTGGVYRFLHGVRFTPIHLGILAALSEGHDVTVVDGDWEPLPWDDVFDLVGITVTTFTSERAYAIARRFREHAAKVVMGGVHPSLLPEECLAHCDAVVVGEAENVWPTLLEDAERGALRRIYRSDGPVAMNDVPFPRRELLNEPDWLACVQATRGCPNRCRYCYLPSVPWGKYRKRDVATVVEEVKRCPQDVIFFVDDNLFADRAYALALMKRITPLRKLWSVQTPTVIARDTELLEAMRTSGCFYVQVGFQTVNPRSLEWARVKNRVEEYRHVVRRFHDHGIYVAGFFIFGFDDDGPDVFDRTATLIRSMDLEEAHLYVLTPYPGTEFHEQLKREGRLLPGRDRLDYGWANAVFQPKHMSPEQLERGVQRTYENLRGFFNRKALAVLPRSLPWLIRRPALMRAVVGGGLRRVHLARHP